jgi:hypothetical protein
MKLNFFYMLPLIINIFRGGTESGHAFLKAASLLQARFAVEYSGQ